MVFDTSPVTPRPPPARAGISIGDSLAATFAALGTLVAVHSVGRTGKGQVVDSAIYEAVLAMMESLIPEWQVAGYQRERSGATLPNVAPSNIYPTADDEMILIAANQDTVFGRLADVMGQPELEDQRALQGSRRTRPQHGRAGPDHRASGRRSSTPTSCSRSLHADGVPAGRIYRAKDMMSDPHFKAREAIVRLIHPQIGELAMHNVFPRLSATPGKVRKVGPTLGENNEEIYKGLLGMDDAAIASLHSAGDHLGEEKQMTYRLGVDVGGTFTDILLVNEESGETFRAKTSSTPADQSIGVLRGIDQVCKLAGIELDQVTNVLHGTTVATNAILEGKGARVGLVTTQGFRQVLQIARSFVPGGLAGWIIWPKPEPLAALEDTVEVQGASAVRRATVVTALDEDDVRQQLRKLKEQGVEALTVSLINSYANGAHEQRIAEIAAEELPGIPVSVSSSVLPEMREYERTLTTVANAYVQPQVAQLRARTWKTSSRSPAPRTAGSSSCAATAA